MPSLFYFTAKLFFKIVPDIQFLLNTKSCYLTCGVQYTQTHSVVLYDGFSVCYFGFYVKSHGVYLSLYFLVFVM